MTAPGPSRNERASMRLLLKFNLLLLVVFGVSIGITAYVARNFLWHNAREEVIQQARLMMGAAGGMRTYTSEQLNPLLAMHEKDSKAFPPQRVPAYSATEVFSYLRQDYPAYTYKEATLNPTNLRDRAVSWEADIIEDFRNHPDKKELLGQRETPEGASLFLARPIAAAPPCLACHSVPSAAPPLMIGTYGPDHGFGWQPNEIVAAQIVSIPMSLPVKIANNAFHNLLISLVGVFLFTLALLDLGLILIVIHPVDRLSRMAEEISRGNLHVPEVPSRGWDEIAQLARSFNHLAKTLAIAQGTDQAE